MANKQELFNAAKNGNFETVRRMISNDPSLVSAKDKEDGWTALHFACYHGHLEIARLLLENGTDVHAKDKKDGWTALHFACWKGHLEIARLLLDNGTDVNAKDKYGKTALHCTCWDGHLDIARLLLENGTDVHAKNINGDTALHCACQEGYLDIARLLLDNGADVHAKNNGGKTALHDACWDGHLVIARLLLDNGTDLNAKDNKGETALDLLNKYSKNHPNDEAFKSGLEEVCFGKTLAQLFLSSSPIFQATAKTSSSTRIGVFAKRLEKEVSRKPNTTDVDALRALGYCHDHGISVQQDSKRALKLYLQADRVLVNQKHKAGSWKFWKRSSSSLSSSFSTTAAWLHKIDDPRVSKFATRAALDHHVHILKQLVDAAAKSSADVNLLKEAAAAKKEIALLEGLFELEAFRSLENMQEELEALQQKKDAEPDLEKKIPIAEKIQALQQRCREEEKKQADLGIAKKAPPKAPPQEHPPQKASGPQHAKATPPAAAAGRTGADPYEVFLVHTGVDKGVAVSTLKQALSSAPNGFRCFLDQDDLKFTTGSPTENMRYALETCRYSVVVISKAFLQRKDPCAELAYCYERMKWLREHGIWESLCVILYDITVEEYKQHCKSAPVSVPEGLVGEVTMVLWNSKGCEYKNWPGVCQHVKEGLVAHDREKSVVEKWNEFLERRRQNDSTTLLSFPKATELYE